jgi:hypothetical protein
MKRTTHVLGVTCALVAVAIGHVVAQTSRVEGGVRQLNGVDFYWETRLVPPVPPLDERLQMLTLGSGPGTFFDVGGRLGRSDIPDTVHRVMLDWSRKVYFGYDAQITTIRSESATYRIAFGPLSLTAELQKILGEDRQAWKELPAPRFPAPRVVRSGEVLELSLLTSDAWGQQMIEYVTLQEPRRQGGFNPEPPREFAFAVGSPRDLVAGDVELRLDRPQVTTTGMATFKSPGGEAGPIVWMYVPGRGRFLLSLTPRSGFRRAGEVRGTSLRFIVDGQTYNVVSSTRIAPATAAFNLYVLRQPEWKPTYTHANVDTIHIGSADRLEYLVGKQ